MANECFNCASPASEQYTLVLTEGKVLKNKFLCDECVAAFREWQGIEVHEGPVLMRGGDQADDTDTEQRESKKCS